MAITPENTSSDNVVNPPKSTMSKDESADTRLDHDLAVQAQAQEEEEDVNGEEEGSPPPVASVEFTSFASVLFPSPSLPSYTLVSTSPALASARAMMQRGELEECLLATGAMLASILEHPAVDNNDLHPCLPPLYYLYGTVLLYTVEEAGEFSICLVLSA